MNYRYTPEEIGMLNAEIERLTAALEQCAAPFDTGETTIQGAGQIIAQEFHRRMNIAGAALIGYRAVEQKETPKP